MKKTIKVQEKISFVTKYKYLLLFFIVFIGFLLRTSNLTTWPRLGATFDEFAWTWLGVNLINNHVPESWSPHPQYEGHRKYVVYQNAKFWVVKPYLEHPPLFGLVAGTFAKLNGVSDMYHVTIQKIRPLSLILGIFSIIMVFVFVNELYGTGLALFSSLLYATVPTVAVGSRLVQNENFFIPFLLLALFSISKYLKTNRNVFLVLSSVICGLLSLAKVPWLAGALGVGLVLLFNKRYKAFAVLIGITLAIFSIYFVYGFYFNKDLFLSLWGLQLHRYDLTFNSVFALFTEPFLADRYTIDGWIYFGWFAFFLLLIKDFKKNYLLILPLMAYFAVFVFAIPNEPGHGWYRYPFYPFLIISIAIFIKDHFNKNLLLTSLFILLIGLSLLEQTWTRKFGFSFLIFRGFMLVAGSALLPLFIENKRLVKASYYLNYMMLVFLIFLNVWAVLSYNEQ